jgi:outer membrane lipoprotein SlyB
MYEAKGELISRDAEKDKVETMFGMAQGDLAQKKAAVEAGKAKIMGGIGGIASGVLGGFASGAIGKGTGFGDFMSGASNGGQSLF